MVLCWFTCFLLFLDGSLRVDANISIKKSESSPLGTKTEIKNISGFKFLAKAIGTMYNEYNEAYFNYLCKIMRSRDTFQNWKMEEKSLKKLEALTKGEGMVYIKYASISCDSHVTGSL